MEAPPDPRDVAPPSATGFLGGPLGRYAAPGERSWRRLAPVVVASAVLPFVGAWLRQGHCVQQGWSGDDQFWRQCFSDLPAQYQIAGLSRGLPGWAGADLQPEGTPPLVGLLMAAIGGIVPAGDPVTSSRWYLAVWAVVLVACAMVTVWCVAAIYPRHLDLASRLALSPVVITAGLLTGDGVLVMLVALAMYAWVRGWWIGAGVLLGLGCLGRPWVVAVVVALLLWGWRRRRLSGAVATAGVAVATAGLLAALVSLVNGNAVGRPLREWWSAQPSYGSLWFLPQGVKPEWALGAPATQVILVLVWVLALGLGVLLVRTAWHTPTWPQTALVVAGTVTVLAPVYPVQASLWVLLLAALSGVRWRDLLVWAAVEIGHASLLWLYIAAPSNPEKGLPVQWYALAVVLRIVTNLWIVTQPLSLAGTPQPGDERRAEGAVDERERLSAHSATMEVPASTPALAGAGRGSQHNPPVTEGP